VVAQVPHNLVCSTLVLAANDCGSSLQEAMLCLDVCHGLVVCLQSCWSAHWLSPCCRPLLSRITTGGIKVYVKDKSGASIPNAQLEVTSTALLGAKKGGTDSAGYYYFQALPPGDYNLTVSARTSVPTRRRRFNCWWANSPPIEVTLEIGSKAETIEVTWQSAPRRCAVGERRCRHPARGYRQHSEGTFLPVAHSICSGARQEPPQSPRNKSGRNNGFQIDGASDSENTYLVEGLDTTEIQNGGIKQNVIFEFVQEVQVKTSSYQAEYGGAVGGVVNVIQKTRQQSVARQSGGVLSNGRV